MVFDERSEEFRRSVKESLNGPVQANRSDGIKPGIGIERKKNKPTFISCKYVYHYLIEMLSGLEMPFIYRRFSVN